MAKDEPEECRAEMNKSIYSQGNVRDVRRDLYEYFVEIAEFLAAMQTYKPLNLCSILTDHHNRTTHEPESSEQVARKWRRPGKTTEHMKRLGF